MPGHADELFPTGPSAKTVARLDDGAEAALNGHIPLRAPGGHMFSADEGYERFMGRWSRGLAPLMVRFAGVRDGEAILDVGCGTGALIDALARAAPTGAIVGIDPAAPLLAAARARHAGDRIRFETAGAQQLPFADGSFDRTLSQLMLNFVPDYAAALDEMERVTRNHGTVAAAVWDYGGRMDMLRLFWDAAVELNPAADATDERHMPLCRQGELGALWRAHGLQDVVEEALTVETRFESFDDYWSPFLGGQGPAGAYAAALARSDRDALAARLRHRLVEGGSDGPLILHARAWAVRGVVRPQRS